MFLTEQRKVIGLQSNNPVFSNIEKNIHSIPQESTATRGGIALKTLILLGISVLVGFFLPSFPEEVLIAGLSLGGIIGLIAVIVASFSERLAMAFSIVYAVAQGFTVGFITLLAELYVPGIALTAAVSTAMIIAVMMFLYQTRIIRATRFLYRFVLGSLIAFILSSLVMLIISLINPVLGASIQANFALNIVVVLFAIVLGGLMLVLDFNRADTIVAMGASKRAEWQAALGFLISVIWIYIQILRFLLIMAARNRN